MTIPATQTPPAGTVAPLSVLALDLSLTSTGVCLADGYTHCVKTNAADILEVRLEAIVEGVGYAIDANYAEGTPTQLVVIEDFVTASKISGAVAPVHGAVRLWLWRLPLPVALVSPSSLKLYAAGKGTADKTAVAVAAMKRANLDFSSRPDECDAWWLRSMALDAYGAPVVDMPAANRAALEKVRWPSREALAAAPC